MAYVHVRSKVHQGSFGCGCCPSRQKRHRSDPRESHGFRSYYVLDAGEGVGVAVMIFDDRESANAANDEAEWSLFKQACMTLILEIPKSLPGKF